MIKGVIFDIDGVMIDSEPLHMQAWDKALQTYSYHLDDLPESFQKTMAGKKPLTIAKEMVLELGLPISGEELLKMKPKLFNESSKIILKEMPGLTKLVQNLKTKGYRLGIGTSASQSSLSYILDKLDLKDYFEVVVTENDITKGKPHPQTYQLVVDRLGLLTEECVVIEDSQNGILSAKAAGCFCIGLKRSEYVEQDQSSADLIVHSLDAITEDVLQHLE